MSSDNISFLMKKVDIEFIDKQPMKAGQGLKSSLQKHRKKRQRKNTEKK